MTSRPNFTGFNWEAVHQYVQSLGNPGAPVAGTAAWVALDDTDPRKLRALATAGSVWVLEQELAQLHARKQAAIDVAGSRDWSAVAKFITGRASSSYIKRVTA